MNWLRLFFCRICDFLEAIFVERTYLHLYQKMTRGWSDDVTWDLKSDLAKYTIPRLRRFQEMTFAVPEQGMSLKEWKEIIEDMIWSLEWISNTDNVVFETRKESRRFFRGLRLFGKYFADLWW